MRPQFLPLVVIVATFTLGCAEPQLARTPSESAAAPNGAPVVATPSTAPVAAPAVVANDPEGTCAAQCNANQKIKCTATNPNYAKEKFRSLAGPDKAIDECIMTCQAARDKIQNCLAEDTALRKKYVATVRCFPDGKIGSSECENETLAVMNCVANQPRQ